MKTIINSTNFVRGISSVYSPLLYFIFFFVTSSNAGDIVNISSIKVSKGYNASFVLDLEANDIVTVNYRKNGGSADINQLLVQIIDLNQQDEEVMASFNRSGRDFLAAYDGKYRVDFIYQGRGSGAFKQRNLDIGISLDLEGYEGLEEGEAREVLYCTACVIQESEDNALRINYYFTKGDQIQINSSDRKASFLQLKITQIPKAKISGGSGTIIIPEDGTYSFKFYLDSGDDEGSLFNWRELISKSDFIFDDLSIYRERAAAVDPSGSNLLSSAEIDNINSGQSDDLFDVNSSSDSDTEEGSEIDFAKILEDANKNTAEGQKAVAEAMLALKEQLNKKNIRYEITAIPKDISVRLEPELNFASTNEYINRQCELINVAPTDFNFWFYWIGVGDKAEEAFEEHNSEISKIYNKSLGEAAAEYIYGKFGNSSMGRKNPSYPDERKYPEYLFEDAEYAVVDAYNMKKFLAGERYSRINIPTKNRDYVTSDNGLGVWKGPDTEMYFCACNNNKATPVNVFFKFFSILVEEFEY